MIVCDLIDQITCMSRLGSEIFVFTYILLLNQIDHILAFSVKGLIEIHRHLTNGIECRRLGDLEMSYLIKYLIEIDLGEG